MDTQRFTFYFVYWTIQGLSIWRQQLWSYLNFHAKNHHYFFSRFRIKEGILHPFHFLSQVGFDYPNTTFLKILEKKDDFFLTLIIQRLKVLPLHVMIPSRSKSKVLMYPIASISFVPSAITNVLTSRLEISSQFSGLSMKIDFSVLLNSTSTNCIANVAAKDSVKKAIKSNQKKISKNLWKISFEFFQNETFLDIWAHSHCLKITQNVAFEFLQFGIFH